MKNLLIGLLLLVLFSFSGCPAPGGGGGGVTTAQAATAMQTVAGGITLLQNRGSSWAVTGTSPQYTVSFSTTGLSMTGTKTVVGNNDNYVLTITFSNYSDAATGYTLNGTLNYTVNGGAPTTGTITGNLTLSGGPVAKAIWDVSFTSPGPPAGTPTFTGTITCNDTTVDPNTLSLNRTAEATVADSAMVDGMYAIWGNAGSWNRSGNNVSWSTTGLSMTGTDTYNGNIETTVMTVTFANYASAHVYVVSGTVNMTQITDSSANTVSGTETVNLTFAGGPVVTMTGNNGTFSGIAQPHQTTSIVGVLTCNGTALDGKTMPLF